MPFVVTCGVISAVVVVVAAVADSAVSWHFRWPGGPWRPSTIKPSLRYGVFRVSMRSPISSPSFPPSVYSLPLHCRFPFRRPSLFVHLFFAYAQHLGEIEPTRGRKGLSQKRRGDREGGGALPVVSVRLRLLLKGSPPR